MPNINRPSLKHKTNFKTKDGDRWLAFEDDALINQMIEAFMIINSKVIWNKTILKSCNRAFCNLPGGQDFAAVWRDAGVFVSFNPNPDPSLAGITFKKDIAISSWIFKNPNYARFIAGGARARAGACQRRAGRHGEQGRRGNAAAMRLRRPV